MTLEEKILEYKALNAKIKELEESKQKVYQEILSSFPPDKTSIHSENFRVNQYTRLSIKTSLEDARPFKATKTEEVVDKDKIKELVLSGIFVPDVTESRYFFIKAPLE